MKITEEHVQAILMCWTMNDRNHCLVIPNSTIIVGWEADLLTVNKSDFIHEFEIKLNIQDYNADFKKIWKHDSLKNRRGRRNPNYFWYATYEFDIEPPEYAGWVFVSKSKTWWNVDIKKNAPRLNNEKIDEWQKKRAMIIISHQLRQKYNVILKNWNNE